MRRAPCAPMRCGRCWASPTAPASSICSIRWRAAISPAPSRNSASSTTPAPIRSWCCRDLAEFVHLVTRVKVVPAAADNVAFGETERVRARDFAAKLSMRVLSRTWQMLLKGITEVQTATRPAAAAEMVLVRIAYAADLPTPDEAIRMLEQNGGGSPVFAASAAPSRAAPASTGFRDVISSMPIRADARAVCAASRRRGVCAAADGRARAGSRSPRRRCGSRAFRNWWRWPARSAISDQDRARSRHAPGAHRGRPARGRAGTQRRARRWSTSSRASWNTGPAGAGP